jgi:hypothetical protein
MSPHQPWGRPFSDVKMSKITNDTAQVKKSFHPILQEGKLFAHFVFVFSEQVQGKGISPAITIESIAFLVNQTSQECFGASKYPLYSHG